MASFSNSSMTQSPIQSQLLSQGVLTENSKRTSQAFESIDEEIEDDALCSINQSDSDDSVRKSVSPEHLPEQRQSDNSSELMQRCSLNSSSSVEVPDLYNISVSTPDLRKKKLSIENEPDQSLIKNKLQNYKIEDSENIDETLMKPTDFFERPNYMRSYNNGFEGFEKNFESTEKYQTFTDVDSLCTLIKFTYKVKAQFLSESCIQKVKDLFDSLFCQRYNGESPSNSLTISEGKLKFLYILENKEQWIAIKEIINNCVEILSQSVSYFEFNIQSKDDDDEFSFESKREPYKEKIFDSESFYNNTRKVSQSQHVALDYASWRQKSKVQITNQFCWGFLRNKQNKNISNYGESPIGHLTNGKELKNEYHYKSAYFVGKESNFSKSPPSYMEPKILSKFGDKELLLNSKSEESKQSLDYYLLPSISEGCSDVLTLLKSERPEIIENLWCSPSKAKALSLEISETPQNNFIKKFVDQFEEQFKGDELKKVVVKTKGGKRYFACS